MVQTKEMKCSTFILTCLQTGGKETVSEDVSKVTIFLPTRGGRNFDKLNSILYFRELSLDIFRMLYKMHVHYDDAFGL